MGDYLKNSIVSDVSWDLSQAAKDRLSGLAESVEFESEESYRQKLNVLKESFSAENNQQSEYLEESAEPLQPSVYEGITGSMAAYAMALSRTVQ